MDKYIDKRLAFILVLLGSLLLSYSVLADVNTYELIVNIEGSGNINLNEGVVYEIEEGEVVNLEAEDVTGYTFVQWKAADSGNFLSSDREYEVTMNRDRDIVAQFEEAIEVTLEIEGEGVVNINGQALSNDGSYSFIKGEDLNLEAIPNLGWGFRYWSGSISGLEMDRIISGDEDVTIRANFFERRPTDYIDFGSISMNPTENLIVQQVAGNEYIVRPDALRGVDHEEKVNIRFNIVEDPFDDFFMPSRDYVRIYRGSTLVGNLNHNHISWHPSLDGNTGTISISQTGLDNFKEEFRDESFSVQVYTPAGYTELTSFRLRDAIEPPIVDVELMRYIDEFGTLNPNQVYYIPADEDLDAENNIGDLRIRVGNIQTELNPKEFRVSGKTHSRGTGVERTTANIIPISDYTWLNSRNQIDDNLDTDENPLSIWRIDDRPLRAEEIQENFLAIRLEITAQGQDLTQEVARPTYYFVQDDQMPQIRAINVEGNLDDQSYGGFRTRRPQLSAKVIDSISGIDSVDDIEVRYLPIEGEDSMPGRAEDFIGSDEMDIIRLDNRQETRGEGEQRVRFVPYENLREGEYAVLITAQDMAGNSSDDHGDGPFIFYLNIDQTQPRIHNVTFNQRRIDTNSNVAHPVSSDGLELYFEAYGGQDIIYGIRYLDGEEGEGNEWFVIEEGDLDYITRYPRVDLATHQGVSGSPNENYFIEEDRPRDGRYEIFIIADEEGIEYRDAVLDQLGDEGYGWVSDNEISIIYHQDIDSQRRNKQRFEVVVDGTPPEYMDSYGLFYVPDYGDRSRNERLEEGDEKRIVQGRPIFEARFYNISEIQTRNIQVTFIGSDGSQILGGIISHRTDSDDERINSIDFNPNAALSQNSYSIRIEIEDEFGNRGLTEFEDIFRIVDVREEAIKFNIQSGERLNINDSSALEILIDEPSLEPDSSLRIYINGAPVVEPAGIVGDMSKDFGDPDRYREEIDYETDSDYYKRDTYISNDYDILFFEHLGNSRGRIVIFSRLTLPSQNKIRVEVINEHGLPVSNEVGFTVDNYRRGFGFGRLLID